MTTTKVAYTDYDGQKKEKTLYFNINKMEAIRLNYKFEKGTTFADEIESCLSKQPDGSAIVSDPAKLIGLFEDIVRLSYGEKSEDGEHFVKSEQMTKDFMNSAAYEAFVEQMMTDSDVMTTFMANVISSKR